VLPGGESIWGGLIKGFIGDQRRRGKRLLFTTKQGLEVLLWWAGVKTNGLMNADFCLERGVEETSRYFLGVDQSTPVVGIERGGVSH